MLGFKMTVHTCEELDYLRVVPDPGFYPVRADLAILDSVFRHFGKRPEDVLTRSDLYGTTVVRCTPQRQLRLMNVWGVCRRTERAEIMHYAVISLNISLILLG